MKEPYKLVLLLFLTVENIATYGTKKVSLLNGHF